MWRSLDPKSVVSARKLELADALNPASRLEELYLSDLLPFAEYFEDVVVVGVLLLDFDKKTEQFIGFGV